ncbi:MAG: hypothetical protein H6637_00060 [Ardenticatenales bacterium]|nr:hypothetical protein [Ardenticatenales bacterium]
MICQRRPCAAHRDDLRGGPLWSRAWGRGHALPCHDAHRRDGVERGERFVDQPCRLSLHVRAEMGDGQDDGGGAIVAERCFLHGGEQRAVKAGQGQPFQRGE